MPTDEYPYSIVNDTWNQILSELSDDDINRHINKFDKNCYTELTIDEFLKIKE